MKKQLVIIGITLVFLAVGLSGCSSNDDGNKNTNENTDNDFEWGTPGETDIGSVDNRIVGQWSARYESSNIEQYKFNFYTNNTCQYTDNSTQQTLWARFGMFPGIMVNVCFRSSRGTAESKEAV